MQEIELKDIKKDYRSNEAYKSLRTNIPGMRTKYSCLQVVHQMKEKVR